MVLRENQQTRKSIGGSKAKSIWQVKIATAGIISKVALSSVMFIFMPNARFVPLSGIRKWARPAGELPFQSVGGSGGVWENDAKGEAGSGEGLGSR